MRLFCEYEINPVGIDTEHPVLSWIADGTENNCIQKKFSVFVAESIEDLKDQRNLCWHYEEESDAVWTEYRGKKLKSTGVYFWRVEIILNNGMKIQSDIAVFEVAFLNPRYWKAKWMILSDSFRKADVLPADCIGEINPETMEMKPVYRIRKEFTVGSDIEKIRIYATAHGVYTIFLDGVRVGNFELAPEHTWYPEQLLYQIYKIDSDISSGQHTVALLLADGWYAGRIGFDGDNCQYGTEVSFLFQMEILYKNGKMERVCSDETWEYEESAWEYADLFVGEKYNAQKHNKNFFACGYQSDSLRSVQRMPERLDNLRAQNMMHIHVSEQIDPVKIWKENKSYIVDFGVTIAGKYRIYLEEKRGTKIYIDCSEVLDQKGKFIKNIRESYKNQTDIYVCSGKGKELYEPLFTYHGFRYLRISGMSSHFHLKNIKALAITSKMRKTLEFSCSDERLNKLQKNIERSYVSNMISIPTDCPQREKAGWTGDVQVFAPTACYLSDTRNFYNRWLRDMRAQQKKNGEIPIIIPFIKGYEKTFEGMECSSGWGDVSVILPWTLYNFYGDKKFLLENYEMMERWVEYMRVRAATENPEKLGECSDEELEHLKYIWNTGFHFGDWLTPSVSMNLETGEVDMMQSAYMTQDIVPTLFFYHSTRLLSRISKILGYTEKVTKYGELGDRIRNAFDYEYFDCNGELKSDLQGVCILALAFGILKADKVNGVEGKLIQAIRKNGGKLDTGFLSVPYVLEVLLNMGARKEMYEILFQEECPSWLYEVKQGATSMWESWQAVLPDGRCMGLSMNHYATGCVGQWMYQHLAGIQMAEPAFKRIRIIPELDAPLGWVECKYDSVYGVIFSSWRKKGKLVELYVEIPVNTSAELILNRVEEKSLKFCEKCSNCRNIQTSDGKIKIRMGAGKYQYTVNLKGEI